MLYRRKPFDRVQDDHLFWFLGHLLLVDFPKGSLILLLSAPCDVDMSSQNEYAGNTEGYEYPERAMEHA
jgi:hypothetical protein